MRGLRLTCASVFMLFVGLGLAYASLPSHTIQQKQTLLRPPQPPNVRLPSQNCVTAVAVLRQVFGTKNNDVMVKKALPVIKLIGNKDSLLEHSEDYISQAMQVWKVNENQARRRLNALASAVDVCG